MLLLSFFGATDGVTVYIFPVLTAVYCFIQSRPMNSEYIVSLDDRILVTGANGFIGTRVVAALLEYGFTNLRCFVRPSSRFDRSRRRWAISMPGKM